jgi:DEAD/DEAH box helicase domain-containing protein
MRRICQHYGSDPTFICSSATIANPRELAEGLTGRPFELVEKNGAPRGEKFFLFVNPPVVNAQLGIRRSYLAEARRVSLEFLRHNLQLILFAQSRLAVEILTTYLKDAFHGPPGAADVIRGYRGGYLPNRRREIERGLREGQVRAVVSTNALELGIDIGALDCAISVAFPGTVSSLRQQWGRAGRREHGVAVLVASEDALDQFFMRDPEALLSRTVEAAILDHANPRVLDGHVLSAAFEGPIDEADAATLGPEALERAAVLPELKHTGAGWIWAGTDYPAARVGLRSGEPESFTVIDRETGSVLGLVERSRAYSTVHEGAVYLHLGEQHLVRALDLEARTALVSSAAADWYTQAKKETQTAIVEPLRAEPRLGLELFFGRVSVTEQVVAYQRKSISGGDTLETVPLDLPETSFETEAVWFSPTTRQLEGLEEMPKLLSSLHAAEHSLIALLPLWAMCDRWDIGGLSTNVHFQTGRPTIFVYDGHAGGVGIIERGFDRFEGWVEDTARMLAGCPCSAGCPSCVQSPKCGNLNEFLDKAGALLLLRRLLPS